MTVKEKVLSLLMEAEGRSVSGEEIAKTLQVTRSAVWKGIQGLKKAGYQVEGVPNKGYRLVKESDRLSAQAISGYLGKDKDKYRIQVYQEVTSTNDVLKKMAEERAPEGTIVLAESQLAGRGRKDRRFYSPSERGIYMSLLLKPQMDLSDARLITCAAAAATARAIEEITGQDTKIKWVNDLFLEDKKICGILTEASMSLETGAVEYFILGIGVNVYLPEDGFPRELKSIAASLYPDRKTEIRNPLAARIIQNVMEYYRGLEEKTFYQEYRKRSFIIGRKVKLHGIRQEERAQVLDLDQGCRLVVKLENGTVKKLQGGEVSLLLEE